MATRSRTLPIWYRGILSIVRKAILALKCLIPYRPWSETWNCLTFKAKSLMAMVSVYTAVRLGAKMVSAVSTSFLSRWEAIPKSRRLAAKNANV
jgi:hypothetical protein